MLCVILERAGRNESGRNGGAGPPGKVGLMQAVLFPRDLPEWVFLDTVFIVFLITLTFREVRFFLISGFLDAEKNELELLGIWECRGREHSRDFSITSLLFLKI